MLFCDPQGIPWAIQRIDVEARDYGLESWVHWQDCMGRQYSKQISWVLPLLKRPIWLHGQLVRRLAWFELERNLERWWPKTAA
jgi:hypothetical protein